MRRRGQLPLTLTLTLTFTPTPTLTLTLTVALILTLPLPLTLGEANCPDGSDEMGCGFQCTTSENIKGWFCSDGTHR